MNPKRGEAKFKVGAKEYKIRFSLNVLCSLEEELGRPLTDLVLEWSQEKVSLSDVRKMIRAALTPNHPEITLEGAGDLMEEAGLETVLEALTTALNRSAISDQFVGGEEAQDPRTGTADGIGMPSSIAPSPPA